MDFGGKVRAIDVLYIGPESDKAAIEFMRRLAKTADGRVSVNDIGTAAGARKLQQCIAGLLPEPST